MCGICGFNWKDESLVGRMAGTMVHRGPDQHGEYCADGVSLGHRRLSIIDLSENGRQPLSNEDGSIRLAFNGEIYNFQDVRRDLESHGHVFRSQSDSEVIVHAYEQYGLEAVHKLRGMFAFAIWDAPRRRLWLARDRIGIKPLYYHWQDGRLVFASEIKAILEAPHVSRRLDPQALYDYLGFEFVPAPATLFEGIRKLPAGHTLVLENGQIDVRRYWDLRFTPRSELRYDEAVARQGELLDEAVRTHLVSDVPLGVFLSGGLDSSTVVAMMRRHVSGPLRTFTIGYADKSFSEVEYARQVADYFATDHQVLMIEDLSRESLERTVWHLDEPMTDLSAVPLYLVCRQAKAHVTVCLSGEGGDENYAGYDRFRASRLNRWFGAVPRALRHGLIAPLVRRLPDRPQKKGAINMLRRFVEGSCLPADGRHLRWQYFLNPGLERDLFAGDFRRRVNADPFRQVREASAACDATDEVNREIYLDTRFMMTDSVLMKVDKMSMASSVEIRVPFLDHVLVEFLASLPGDWKLRGLETKHILRSGLEGLLPHNIVHRGKQGYSLPVKHLLRGPLKDFMAGLLNESPLVRRNFRAEQVNRLIEEHVSGARNHNHVLWALMNAAAWQQRFRVEC